MKKLLTSLIFILSASYACAYETCLITADGKLTDISIENNDIIDVCPIFTILNEKNTLLVRPLKEGETRFCVLKNNKDKIREYQKEYQKPLLHYYSPIISKNQSFMATTLFIIDSSKSIV